MKMKKSVILKYMNGNSVTKVGGNFKNNERMSEYVEEFLKERPDIYLKELKMKLEIKGIFISITSIFECIKKMGYSKKKVCKVCYYRTTQRVQSLRALFREMIRNYHPYSLWFLDESFFNSETNQRNFGWGKVGDVVETYSHKLSNKTYSLLCCMSAYGIVHSEVIETTKHKVNSQTFKEFLECLIEFGIPPHVTLYMDNAKIHHTSEIKALLDLHGVNYLYSSPYSPDYNPIELLFSWIKYKVKGNVGMDIYNILFDTILEVNEEHCKSWIDHCAKNWLSEHL